MYFTSSCQRRCNSVYQITSPPPPYHWKVITEYCVSENAVGAFGLCLILPSSCGNGPSWLLVYSLFVSPVPAESDKSHNNLRIWMLHYWLSNGLEYRRTALSWKHLCFLHLGSFSFLEFGNSHQVFSGTHYLYDGQMCPFSPSGYVYLPVCLCLQFPKRVLYGVSHISVLSVCVRTCMCAARVHVMCRDSMHIPGNGLCASSFLLMARMYPWQHQVRSWLWAGERDLKGKRYTSPLICPELLSLWPWPNAWPCWNHSPRGYVL